MESNLKNVGASLVDALLDLKRGGSKYE